jgi:hypothetical protein
VHDEDPRESFMMGRICGIKFCVVWRFRELNTGADVAVTSPNYQKVQIEC